MVAAASLAVVLSACGQETWGEEGDLEESEAAIIRLDGDHSLISLFSGKSLEISGDPSRNAAEAVQQPWVSSPRQRFEVRSAGNGTVLFVARHSGKCLDVLGFDETDGAAVGQWDCNDKVNQKWRLVRRDGGYEVRSAWNGKCLDVLGFAPQDGARVGVWGCKRAENQLWAIDSEPGRAGEQLVGTQTFGPSYQFTSEHPIVETARRIAGMGSKIIKFSAANPPETLRTIFQMPFTKYFLWHRSSSIYKDGFSREERDQEYRATYDFTRDLLLEYSGSGKTFFLGHWEGDWYLIPEMKRDLDVPAVASEGMIDWLNLRQAAIEDAKRDTPHSGVEVYQYTEVNRVRDAMVLGKRRLVNTVLPEARVDYVSYSAYDVQGESEATVHATLNYIESKLPLKPGISGKRVFVGEFGVPAQMVGYQHTEHERRNREIMGKFLSWGAPYVLYWSMYNNEVENGQQVGYWLIDDRNVKQPLYHTLQGLYAAQRDFEVNFERRNHRLPTLGELRAHALRYLRAR